MSKPLERKHLFIALTFFVIWISSFLSLHFSDFSDRSWDDDLYRTLDLFYAAASWSYEKDGLPPWIELMRFVAPIFTVLAIFELFLTKVRYSLSLALQQWRAGDHFVVAGLTDESWPFIESVRADSAMTVFVVDEDPRPDLVQKAHAKGISVIRGDPLQTAVLNHAKIQKAEQFFGFLDSDKLQVELALRAAEALQKDKLQRDSKLRISLRIDDTRLPLRLDELTKFSAVQQVANVRFYNFFDNAARLLFATYPPEFSADALGQGQIHLAIYGFGRMGEGVAVQAIKQIHTRGAEKLRVSVLDRNPETCRIRFETAYPQISRVCDLSFDKLEVGEAGLSWDQYGDIPEGVTAHVVCFDNEEKAVKSAISLRKLLLSSPPEKVSERRLNAPIFVRVQFEQGMARLLRSNQGEAEIPDGLFPFGAFEWVSKHGEVLSERMEGVAAALHGGYDTVISSWDDKPRPGERPAYLVDWDKLSEALRMSNRQAAEHAATKLRAIRCRRTERPGASKNFEIDEAREVAPLAEIEHRRWMAERFATGWVFSKNRLDVAKRSNLLVEWSQVPDPDREFDLAAVRHLDTYLAAGKWGIQRELVVGVCGHRSLSNVDRELLAARIRDVIKQILARHPHHVIVFMTSLAHGADSIVADVVLEVRDSHVYRDREIELVVPLPLPCEILREDFEIDEDAIPEKADRQAALRKFQSQIGRSDRYFELPIRFAPIESLTRDRKTGTSPEERDKQYAQAGAYIAERSDYLIAVWDGQENGKTGGTAHVMRWLRQGAVEPDYASPEVFLPRPERAVPIVIPAAQEALESYEPKIPPLEPPQPPRPKTPGDGDAEASG